MSIVERAKQKIMQRKACMHQRITPYYMQTLGDMRPKSLLEPDRDTFYCDVQSQKLRVAGVKILQHYPSGDCRVLTPNGVQFTARADEVYNIRKGDYHLPVEL